MLPATPCLMIDETVMRANLKCMAEACAKYGCLLRPHVKTHKCPELALIQAEYGGSAITVAKLGEAEVFAQAGFSDIFMAYPIVGREKLERAVELKRRIRLILSVDSLPGAKALSDAAVRAGLTFEVRVEVDTGMRRSGVPMEDAVSFALEVSRLPSLNLTGIFTYRNLIFEGKPDSDAQKCGFDEGRIMVRLKEEMQDHGLVLKDVSVGSTATAIPCASVPGVTEVRPGTYIFYDTMQLEKGACDETMFAAHVDATVISVKGSLVIIDAGTKSISADCHPGQPPYNFKGFGKVLGHDDLILYAMTEEHGMLETLSHSDAFRVGDRLSIVPNHICTTVNLYDYAYLIRNGAVKKRLDILARGANT
ncbi:MAG TPA: alanine racemase [Clostridia bacterium]|nr:alanine racemase [Clostridia bacterium]